MDPITRILGALSLWSIEIVMQMRIFALYNRSKKVIGKILYTLLCSYAFPLRLTLKVAALNALLFLASIAGFLWLMVINAERRATSIRGVKMNPVLDGCPSIHSGVEYLQWIPGEHCSDWYLCRV